MKPSFFVRNLLPFLLVPLLLACNDPESDAQTTGDAGDRPDTAENADSGDTGESSDAQLSDVDPPDIDLPDADLPDADLPDTDLPDSDPGIDEDLLFFDDFSTADMSNHNAFFRWNQGEVPGPGAGASSVVMVQGPHGTGSHARRFRYIGTSAGGSGDDAHFSEQRFALTRTLDEVRSRNDASETAYPEVWISYWLFVPENYNHTLKGGTISGSNQKGWLYLWKDRYEKWVDSVPDEEVTPTSASFHWWPITENESSDFFGMTRASLVATRGRNSWGHKFSASFRREQEQVPESDNNIAFLESEYGTWVHYTFGMKVASDAESNDGFARIYKNGELAIAWEDLSNGADAPEQNGFDRGYLLGYHNAAYTETTTYFLTDFRFGLTREAVMH